MKTKIIKIGNSRGIRILKSFIDESGLKDEAEPEISDGRIIIRPVNYRRSSRGKLFQEMAKNGDDKLTDDKSLNSHSEWDGEEWEW